MQLIDISHESLERPKESEKYLLFKFFIALLKINHKIHENCTHIVAFMLSLSLTHILFVFCQAALYIKKTTA